MPDQLCASPGPLLTGRWPCECSLLAHNNYQACDVRGFVMSRSGDPARSIFAFLTPKPLVPRPSANAGPRPHRPRSPRTLRVGKRRDVAGEVGANAPASHIIDSAIDNNSSLPAIVYYAC